MFLLYEYATEVHSCIVSVGFLSFWDENYRLYPRLQSCMRVKYEISNVSQFLRFSYFSILLILSC